MLELKDAYEILGLNEGADRNEIERKYGKLVRKFRTGQDEPDTAERQEEMDKINEAYNRLISHEDELLEAAAPVRKPNPLFKLIGVDDKKARNYLYYHKYHIIFTILFALIGVYIAVTIIGNVTRDLSIAFIGEYVSDPNSPEIGDSIKKEITKRYPELKNINLELISAPSEIKSQQDSAFNAKAVLELQLGDEDVFIVDKRSFQNSAGRGYYAKLDSFAAKHGIDLKANTDYKLLVEGQKEPHLYGIDVSSSKVLKKSDIGGKEFVAVISARSKKMDRAEKFLEMLLDK